MSLRLIVGRAGTGKTRYCVESFVKELIERPMGPSLILLVPEQATFQMEHQLIKRGIKGFIRGQVLSFRRLAYRVFQEVGGANKKPIDEVGKSMLLRRIIQQKKNALELFQNSSFEPGFIDSLLALFSELHSYNLSPKMLDLCQKMLEEKKGQKILRSKIHDLCLIYQELIKELEGLYTDPDDYLTQLSSKLDKSAFIRDARIWVDGFAGFTPQEYDVLKKLMIYGDKVEITLCLDGRELDREYTEEYLFHRTRETYDRLMELAQREGIEVEDPLILDSSQTPERFKNAPSLAHLEREFSRSIPQKYSGVPENIKLVSAVNLRAEVEACAGEIISLCRDKGYRWRDISIILRNVEPYEDLIKEIFEQYGIPFFIDRKKKLGYHPAAELIRSALDIVINDWPYEAVFRFLKTDLARVERDAVDILENYVLSKGIRGRENWLKKGWLHDILNRSSTDVENKALYELDGVIDILADFDHSFKEASNAVDMTISIFNLLINLNVSETLEKWRQEAVDRGDLLTAQEHSQVWNRIISLLDQIVEIVGSRKLKAVEYYEIINSGLEALRFKLIPPSLDQVFVASIERSRHPEVKASFVLGANEGVFPAKIDEDVLLTDAERKYLKNAVEIELAPPSSLRIVQEQYLAYIALTRPSEFLWVSYSLSGKDGRTGLPSVIVSTLKDIFPALEEETAAGEPFEWEQLKKSLSSKNAVLRVLLKKLRNRCRISEWESYWIEALRWFLEDSERRSRYRKLFESLFFVNNEADLSPSLIHRLYGSELHGGISSMEDFAACPFAYFLKRTLNLKPREEYMFSPAHRGTLFHEALRLFVEHLLEKEIDWETLDEREAEEIIDNICDGLIPSVNSRILLSSHSMSQAAEDMRKTLKKAACILCHQLKMGSFKPVGVEISFGEGEKLEPLVIELNNGRRFFLRGRIDRIDLAEHNGKLFVRVLDYKSSSRNFKLYNLYHGLELQLMAYLSLVVEKGEELFGRTVFPAGILYFTVESSMRRGIKPLDEGELERNFRKEFRMTGLLLEDREVLRLMDRDSQGNSDIIPVVFTKEGIGKNSSVASYEQFSTLMSFTKRKLAQLAQRILDGEVSIYPYRCREETACNSMNCEYSSVCLFDPLLGNFYRNILPEKNERILRRIYEEMGEGNGRSG
ncbi:MAG TPA: helicase-exonuclease AddAB subunit AddB [Peptococcaceae bacterium]|nr:MAG: ATP-dependent helicase/deoxyribonuclease subunit B [Clostridia bacterium 41_269]HBT20230.1 helicase-exonuclease AddAB subunit AddB [Peptococcaceae bacterium]